MCRIMDEGTSQMFRTARYVCKTETGLRIDVTEFYNSIVILI